MNSSSLSSNRTRGAWDRYSNDAASDARRSMTQRSHYSQTVQIRKQRKEEILLQKRKLPSFRATSTAQQQQSQQMPCDDSSSKRLLQQFLSNLPPTRETLEPLLLALNQQQHESALLSFLEQLVKADLGASRLLLEHVKTLLLPQQGYKDNNDEDSRATRTMALVLLEALVSVTSSTAATAKRSHLEEEDDVMFYTSASPPVRWSDLLLQDESLLPLLVSLLPQYPLASSVIAHVYQDSTQHQSLSSLIIPRYWPDMVAALPTSARLCAVVLQRDATTPACVFLQSLSPKMLTELLMFQQDLSLSSSIAVSGAWMLEGLTRREDEAVEMLCRDATVVEALLHQLASATSTITTTSTDPCLLLPTLRTIGNMMTACQGRFVYPLLTSGGTDDKNHSNSLLVTALPALLCHTTSSAVAEEVLWVMGCCLLDAGLPNDNILTKTVAPLWIPHLVSQLTLSATAAKFEVRRQALQALWHALCMPPLDIPLHQRDEIQMNLDFLLRQYVWSNSSNNIVDSLLQFLTLDSVEVVVTSLRILQRLADCVSDSHLQLREGMDRLQSVCDRNHDGTGKNATLASDLASNLMDQLQEDEESDDDDHETEGERIMNVDPSVDGGTFVFGFPPTANDVTASLSSATPLAASSTPPVMGRGRGRTVPAWMSQQQ